MRLKAKLFLVISIIILVLLTSCMVKPIKPVPPGFVLVREGSFTMGDTLGDGPFREPISFDVTLTYDFYISEHLVTFDEYDEFCAQEDISEPEDMGWGRGTRPVINVSWWDAIAYCNWLSQQESLPIAYRLFGEEDQGQLLDISGEVTDDITKVFGYRLPTEAEWEYAARGRTNDPDYKYSGSDNVDEVAWYLVNSYNDDHGENISMPVKLLEPNALGIYDMSGNVWEWCTDSYYSYTDDLEIVDPYYPNGTNYRVVRGGSFLREATEVRLVNRSSFPVGIGFVEIGFRVARTAFWPKF